MTAVKPPTWEIWLEATRPKTLPAAVSPVLVGTALAYRADSIRPTPALICLSFALLIQIGTNFANDYYDYQKGADTTDRVGPRRAVASGLVQPSAMKAAMLGTFLAAFVIGLGLLPYGSWPLLIIGISSIVCGIAYTGGPYPLAYHGLGDIFVFVFFGLVAVGSTVWVQVGSLPTGVWPSAAGVGALATNILLVNNYRDIETDAKAGKRTLLVKWGRDYGQGQFLAAHILAILAPVSLVFLGEAQPHLASLVTGTAVWVCLRQTRRLKRAITPGACINLLGETGRWLGIYGLLIAGAIAVG